MKKQKEYNLTYTWRTKNILYRSPSLTKLRISLPLPTIGKNKQTWKSKGKYSPCLVQLAIVCGLIKVDKIPKNEYSENIKYMVLLRKILHFLCIFYR